MKKKIIAILVLLSLISCNQSPKPFNYSISGKVIGQDTGKIFFYTSSRVGDEIVIPVENGTFKYEGKAYDIVSTSMMFYEYFFSGGPYFPFVIEPGIIELELHKDSTYDKSRILKGKVNLEVNKVKKELNRILKIIFNKENSETEQDSLLNVVYKDSLVNIILNNKNNYGGIYLLSTLASWNILSDGELNKLFSTIKNNKLRQTPAFKKAYSVFLAKKENINRVGKNAYDFTLPDSSGIMINFSKISQGKTVFIESSGSWCSNQTNESNQLKPIYEKYKSENFEIITIVNESKYLRWKNWLNKNKYPWINLVEMEYGNPNKVYYDKLLFGFGDYLVDEKGIIIENNLTPEKLNEILMKKYEPEKYAAYSEKKWNLPSGIYLLDRDQKINTFKDLATMFPNKAFFIDCYATWCAPCLEEFKYKNELTEFLNKNNIKLVYISFDRKLGDAKWLKFIKKHELTGYHMRANENFNNDFRQKAKFNGQLPTYLIVDEKGNIVETNAYRPSSKKKLFIQLKQKLNL